MRRRVRTERTTSGRLALHTAWRGALGSAPAATPPATTARIAGPARNASRRPPGVLTSLLSAAASPGIAKFTRVGRVAVRWAAWQTVPDLPPRRPRHHHLARTPPPASPHPRPPRREVVLFPAFLCVRSPHEADRCPSPHQEPGDAGGRGDVRPPGRVH